jgi:hypothetical protein
MPDLLRPFSLWHRQRYSTLQMEALFLHNGDSCLPNYMTSHLRPWSECRLLVALLPFSDNLWKVVVKIPNGHFMSVWALSVLDLFTLLDLFPSSSPSNVYAKFAKALQFGPPEGSFKFLNKIHKYFAIRLTNYEIRGACGAYGGDGRCIK